MKNAIMEILANLFYIIIKFYIYITWWKLPVEIGIQMLAKCKFGVLNYGKIKFIGGE